MEKLDKEIKTMSTVFQAKEDALKLASTRLENRYLRIGVENVRDEPELGLRDEVVQLKQTIKDIHNKLDCLK